MHLRAQGTCSYVLTGTEKGMQETFGRCVRVAIAVVLRSDSRNPAQHLSWRWQSKESQQLA